ncbi:hypothetical protein [Marinomonas primoryensis]|jgi:hypothetical protein|uniref:DUF4760 domain-containing protein n=1 Tax=Marinomonas primoryensis TaxID=178399 RepID=A0ABV0L127_9GAMM
MMKVNYRILIWSCSTFLIGIFIGFLIVDQNLVLKGFQTVLFSWAAVGGLGSIFAACVALFVAFKSWKKADEVRREDLRQKDYNSALIAYSYFKQLSRVATFLASKNNVNFKNGNGQATQRIEEIYDGWKHANNSADCVRSIIYADNWATEIDLIDTFEMMIQVARSGTHLQEDRVLDNNRFEALNYALNVFACLSHLHSRDIGGLKATDLSIEIENNAKKSLDKLKDIQRRVKEASKG